MSPRPLALAWTLLTALLAGCAREQPVTALLARVEVAEDNRAACVRLVVRPESGPDQLTGPLERTKDSFRVAVYRAPGLGSQVTLLARGYPNCITQVASTEGPPVAATFPASGSTEILVPLPLRPVAGDADRDGHVDKAAGGDDCNDRDATVFPGAPEDCAGDVDRNCNGSSGCLDPSCEGKGCKAGGTCSALACVGAERELCDDGVDNDGNGKADCADEACDGQSCSDANACTQGETCISDNGQRRCGGPEAITRCTQPPNPCFQGQGTCDAADGGCTYVLKNPLPACDDGDACTMSDMCLADGGCGGSPVQCNGPTGSCFAPATCNPDGGFCEFPILVGNACDDGLLCTVGDRCLEDGACAPTGSVSCDAGTCQLSVCMTANGQCSAPIPANNGGACDDGNGCTLSDTCAGGTCAGINATCDDTNPCTDDACDPSGGGCVYTVDDTNTCMDGNACTGTNGVDRCFQGACVAGTPKACSDSNVCTSDSCDAVTGNCVFTPASGTPCSDGNGCTGTNGADTCNNGICVPGAAKVCSDNNPCTDDSCNPADGACRFDTNDTNTCSDDSLCTTNDRCSGGACVGTAITCSDGNGCTTDSCNPATGCNFTANVDGACNDGNLCTLNDACLADAGCGAGTPKPCSDGNPCTDDSCNPADGACRFDTDDTNTCSDNSLCTTDDRCIAGTCTGTAFPCSDGNGCTADSCNPALGCVFAVNVGAACNDGNACTVLDTCLADAGCNPGAFRDCNDDVSCTQDSCNPDGGACVNLPLDVLCSANTAACEFYRCDPIQDCSLAFKDAGTPCPDSDACTSSEACNGEGSCVTSATSCNDNNECTADLCDSTTGCSSTNVVNDTPCTGGGCLNGTCIQKTFFGTAAGQVPSNFVPTEDFLLPVGPLTVSLGCTAVLNTGTLNGATLPSFTPCNGSTQPNPTVHHVTQTDGATVATVLSVTTLTVAGTLNITGERPAILAVYGDATITDGGTVDASANMANAGAGAALFEPAASGTGICLSSGGSTSGAAGGANAGPGGNGGTGNGGTPAGVTGPTARTGASQDALVPLVGGQSGGRGGSNESSGKPAGGGGGGGLQLSVAGKLNLYGTLAAVGGGGAPGTLRTGGSGGSSSSCSGNAYGQGGGGGGSGGSILVEASRVVFRSTARVMAGGGSGGEGANKDEPGATGVNGSKTSTTAASGGSGAADKGGNGGSGGSGTSVAGVNATNASGGGSDYSGGGGGGGGAGRIRVNALVPAAQLNNAHLCRETGHLVSPGNLGGTTTQLVPGFSCNFSGNLAAVASANACTL